MALVGFEFGGLSSNEKFPSVSEAQQPEVYDVASIDSNGKPSAAYRDSIRTILCDFLRDINVVYPSVTYDEEFTHGCSQAAIERGCPSDVVQSREFQVALRGAASIATMTYGHLEDAATRQYICLYTTCLMVFDDMTTSRLDPSAVREFHARFACARPQLHPALDLLASLLRSSYDHFLPNCANLVISSTLDYMNGHLLEYDLQKMTVSKIANIYPRWMRTMTGNSTPYVIFTFPPDIPLESYIQILPNMVNYLNDVNDLFSFYKEECEHDRTNHISLLAQLTGKSKLQCMKDLATYSVDGSRRCQAGLAACPEGLSIFNDHFLPGYIAFHALAHERYKLDDLGLGRSADALPFYNHSTPGPSGSLL